MDKIREVLDNMSLIDTKSIEGFKNKKNRLDESL
jgi:hypothetical protein